jgi:membrane protein CcdC involved in cytochrome C biogenesis
MKENAVLTTTSLLSIVFTTIHQAVDIFHGQDANASSVASVVLIMVVWMYGTLVLAERRSGYVIILLGSLVGMVVLGVHMSDSRLANSAGGLFFVVILLALGVTSAFSAILAMRGLWNSRSTLAR